MVAREIRKARDPDDHGASFFKHAFEPFIAASQIASFSLAEVLRHLAPK